ncbi:SpoIID/LytB domain-containing protein [Gorillibacterium timonense]|uniref:SpoIID/LytB domain-containing protein n=1 Tax=Gorillibacterium timonense TaxID=1689269 RepID=UPI00071D3DD1|nr:SpoIID/LytB domain-containing protein [Gorillibacterium timonense]
MMIPRKWTANGRKKSRSWIVAGVLAISLIGSAAGSGPLSPQPVVAASSDDLFRVALYIDSGKFHTTVPTAGFSADKGLKISVSAGTSAPSLLAVSGGAIFRAGLDQYRVSVLETADFNQAKALYSALASKYSPSIYRNGTAAAPVYQVVTGGYATAAAAQTALAEISKLPAASTYKAGALVTGPLRLSAGSFKTEKEARDNAQALRGSGLPVDVVISADTAGKLSYSLWASNASAADAAAQAALKSGLEAAVPGVSLTAVDSSSLSYLAEKEEVSGTAAGSGGTALYLFNPNAQKVMISSAGGKITVKEKSLSYNGTFELSQLNGKLAVINELPFEQYLNSVVHAELGPGNPIEALKAQAVAARTYSVKAGMKYEIANLTDTTLDQAYYGKEADDVTKAVEATRGEVLVSGGKLIDALFSSNAGGQTAEGTEVWGNSVSYLKSVSSPDTYPTRGKLPWYRIYTDSGLTGYVRSDLLTATGAKTAAGIPLYSATDAANIRMIPLATDSLSPVLGKLAVGERVAVIDQTVESTAYAWTRLMTATQLAPKINAYSPLTVLNTLQVNKKGASGRVTSLMINGSEVALKTPDSYRSMLGGLPSTLFEIEETGRYTVIGANGARTEYTGTGASLTALNGQGTKTSAGSQFLVLNGQGKARLATSDAQFLFTGKGYGHGLGMSQYGAIGLALDGKDYKYILAYYYDGATIVKQ